MEKAIGEIAQKMAERHDSPDHKAFRAAFTKSIMQSSSAPHRMKWSLSHPRLWYKQRRGGDWEEDVVTL
jgi:hypothetical protein